MKLVIQLKLKKTEKYLVDSFDVKWGIISYMDFFWRVYPRKNQTGVRLWGPRRTPSIP